MDDDKLHDWLVAAGFGAGGMLIVYALSLIKKPVGQFLLFAVQYIICRWTYDLFIETIGVRVLQRVVGTFTDVVGRGWSFIW